MWLVITLVLLLLYVFALPYLLDAYDDMEDELKRGVDEDYPIGIESSHARPVHDDDGRLIGFVRESRDG